MVSKIFNTCTANIYKDFSSQPSSQKILKVALPLQDPILLANNKIALLQTPIPRSLYNGVCIDRVHSDLEFQSHRWSFPTNQGTLVHLSTGQAYPANLLRFPESGMSYIIAESPLNNEIVDWQTDYYRMAIEQNAGLLLCVDHPFSPDNRFKVGNTLTVDDRTITCESARRINNILAFKLIITRGSEQRTLWQLLLFETFGSSFNEIQSALASVNEFIKKQHITVNAVRPLLVDCGTGLERSARFILFHELETRVKIFIKQKLASNTSMENEAIYQAIFGNQDISDLLKQLALHVEYSSTSGAAIGDMEYNVLPIFNGKTHCPPDTVNSLFKEYVFGMIARCKLQ